MTKKELLEKLKDIDDDDIIKIVEINQQIRPIKSVYMDTDGNAYIAVGI